MAQTPADIVEALWERISDQTNRRFAPPFWRNAVSKRLVKPVTIAWFCDSRGDGTKPTASAGISDSTQTFPQMVASTLRTSYGLPAGGRGYMPMRRSGPDASYSYAGPSLVNGAWANVEADTGVQGSQWVIPVAEGGRTIRIPLQAGTTSVDLISAAPGAGVHYVQMTGQSGSTYQNSATAPGATNTNLVQFTKLINPGTYVDIASPGGGWWALGVIEYKGDETSGFRTINLATAGISAVDYAAAIQKPVFIELLSRLKPDMTVVELGGNDAIQGKTPTAAATAVKSLLAGGGGEPVVITAPVPSTSPTLAGVNVELKKIPATIVDLGSFAVNTSAAEFDGWFHTDLTHLTLVGNLGFHDSIVARIKP